MSFQMAQSVSHSHAATSTPSRLETLSRIASTRAEILRRLAADLELHDVGDVHGDKRMIDVFMVLQDGAAAELDRDGLETMLRLHVPRALVAGDTRER
jgi:hypothetical protein